MYILQVSTDGYFSMGQIPVDSSLTQLPGPSNYSIVAPFAADIDTSSTGSVHYSESFSSTVMKDQCPHSFKNRSLVLIGTWMLVAEWNNVPLYDGSRVSKDDLFISITIVRNQK